MSSKNSQQQKAPALDVESGPITCGSVERRRFLEEKGLEDRVEFVGDAKEKGRQAEEGDHLEEESEEDVRDETGFEDQANGGSDE